MIKWAETADAPLGIVKPKTTFSIVPLFTTSAVVPGSPVVTVPISIVAGPGGIINGK